MTPAELKRRQRTREKFVNSEAKESGYMPVTVLLNKQQLTALGELEHSWGGTLSNEKLSGQLFMALHTYLKADCHSHLKTKLPDTCEVEGIHINALAKFKAWEKQQ